METEGEEVNRILAILQVQGVSASYDKVPVLIDIDIEVEKNEVLAIIGPNGAGKTTLLRTITGLLKPIKGRILLEDHEITSLASHEIVRRGMAMVPEGRRVFPDMSVMENLLMGAYQLKSASDLNESLEYNFKLFPILRERKNQMGGTLSGGQQQMLAVARALMCKPKILLLDEPSMGLAPVVVDQLYDSLYELSKTGITMVVVEQNISEILAIASKAYVLQRGKVIMHGSAAELQDKNIAEMYLMGT